VSRLLFVYVHRWTNVHDEYITILWTRQGVSASNSPPREDSLADAHNDAHSDAGHVRQHAAAQRPQQLVKGTWRTDVMVLTIIDQQTHEVRVLATPRVLPVSIRGYRSERSARSTSRRSSSGIPAKWSRWSMTRCTGVLTPFGSVHPTCTSPVSSRWWTSRTGSMWWSIVRSRGCFRLWSYLGGAVAQSLAASSAHGSAHRVAERARRPWDDGQGSLARHLQGANSDCGRGAATGHDSAVAAVVGQLAHENPDWSGPD